MSDFITKLVSKAASSTIAQPNPESTPIFKIIFKPDNRDSHITSIHLAHSPNPTPLFIVRTQWFHKPNTILFCNGAEIGHATFPNFRHTTVITYQGQSFPMRVSGLTGYQSFDAPILGRLKWQPAIMVGSTIELKDSYGNKLGRFKPADIPGTTKEKMLELYFATDEYNLGLLVLTVMAAAAQVPKGDAAGAVGDVVSAVASI
ncbi:hypothetical protein GLAREA_11568 [Glarea lozoyensis ATCC 20868]|uniref:Uncharacterized protein n=1 Tax=Glarea lozoyensis (strain ATCC 20868 / MF5171) TaxID=1116229 RepID=S3CER5_GLAL2|nr:uncharacterized protein GLAREA_11568 [Glarea lozoyensis ATCC 20868]EPE24987.1 hypothetical protein GLAREA_11568 [Glarea lozoyensis ATCC 20868]